MPRQYWLLLEKSDETRVSKGIDGYLDLTGEFYHYDSLVPNHKNLSEGDYVVLRKENDILGIGEISRIEEKEDAKIHRRCPKCESTDIRERAKKTPKWKCGKCGEEFTVPKETIADVVSFIATIESFSKLDSNPSAMDVKACSATGDGISSQLSILKLDEKKIRTLLEGNSPTITAPKSNNNNRGQGFGLSQAERKAVEIRAMSIARELYEARGWNVVDTSNSHPYDFKASKDDDHRYIEVKGTTGAGDSIVLTHGEVKHVNKNPRNSALVVVSGIVLGQSNDECVATQGEISTHEDPWVINDERLMATQYRYDVK